MHIKVEKEAILEIIEHVEGVVEKRNTIPILSNILLEARGDRLSVTATDLSITARERISGVAVEEEGKATVASAIFSALVRKMPNGTLIDMKVENQRMIIRGGRIRFAIPVLPAEDFPIGKEVDGDPIVLPIESIMRAFRLVKDSISTEETRYYLNGAFLAIEDEKLVAVSTDGHRLSLALISETRINKPDAIVPRKAVNEILKILPDFEGDMTVRLDQSTISFEIGELLFSAKLIDGTFPDYTRIMPKDGQIMIHVNPSELQQAIERVSVISSEKTSAIKLHVEREKMTISATNPDTGTAQEEVAIQANDEIVVGYNGRYLREILANYQNHDTIIISLTNETSPALIHPEGVEIDRSVIMPMRI